MRPICVPCKVQMRPENNGVQVVYHSQTPPQPYEIWDADEWKCPKCGHCIITGFGGGALHQHWQPDFAAALARIPAKDRRDSFEWRSDADQEHESLDYIAEMEE